MTIALTADRARQTLPRTDDRIYRSITIDGAALDEAALTVRATILTNAPVQRNGYVEILDPAGLIVGDQQDWPLLKDHVPAAGNMIGRVFDLSIGETDVSANLRFSTAPDVEPIVHRVKDGTLAHVSVGYVVSKWAERTVDGVRTRTAVAYRLLEVSVVPIPADRRSRIQRSESMEPEELTPAQIRAEIRSICRAAGLPSETADDMIDRDLDPTAARAEAFEALQARPTPRIRVTANHDDPAATVTRASDALAHRMGGIAELPDASREFAPMSLLDMARDSLTRAGVSVRGLSTDEVLTRAAHGASDFPLVVSNAANKTLLETYKAAESPLKLLARQRTLPNFKESAAIRLGAMGRLEEVSEHGEIKATSRGEAGEKMQLATYARRFDLTRRLIIDDDTGAFGDIVAAMGQAAAQTEADLLVSLLIDNPKMSDGKAVFHADHANLSAGAALSEESLSVARLAMRQRTDLGGKTLISATPKFLVVGPELETLAEKLLASITATTTADVNPFARLQLLVEPRIADDQWFVFADPARLAGLQYAYLSGAQGPQIQRREEWDVLGISFRCFEDFGAAWTDWRAAQKNPGA